MRVSIRKVDHFIPWSFIKDNNLWKFVLACPRCNNNMRDKLANKKFLNDLVIRNRDVVIEKHHDMKNYQENKLQKIYDWAKDNGYGNKIWTPTKSVG